MSRIYFVLIPTSIICSVSKLFRTLPVNSWKLHTDPTKKAPPKVYGTQSSLSVISHYFGVFLLEMGSEVIFQHLHWWLWLHTLYCLVPIYSNMSHNSQTLGLQVNDCHGLMNKDVSVTSSKVKLTSYSYSVFLLPQHPESMEEGQAIAEH